MPAVVAPDEPVAKVVLHCGLQLPQPGLTPGSGACPRSQSCMGMAEPAMSTGRCTPILFVLAVPDQLRLHSGERMGAARAPANGLQEREGPPGGDEEESSKESLCRLSESINCNCPADGSFPGQQTGKAFASENVLVGEAYISASAGHIIAYPLGRALCA